MRQAMRGIEPLPLLLRNSIRSGVIVFDFTRVVEELLFNSLDASATKVSIFVGAETGCVKVVDNGSGISRDGLILLGERYVTSKLCSDTFGFRGETLASISDVSLLEIVTRTRGRPNGYRKVLKGSKCLYFGIDDNRKDVGTIVVVRDLFYNQPVRRKFIQSSSKKVLQSVKKCVLQVALVHSRVSFQIIDIESEKELLSTYRSSAMSILMSDYGINEVNSLHKLDFSDGFLSLSGYITCPSDDFSAKAFQYVYINSRFVFKGPIHKLLNHLAMTFEVLDSWGAMSEKGKRSRAQVCIAYIMNLYCPRDLYDLTLEPSKTYADFKDWGPILTFIQKAVQQVWSKILSGENSSHRVDLHSTLWKGNDDMMSTKEVLSETSEVASDKFQRPQYYIAYSPVVNLKKHPDEIYNGDYKEATYEEFELDFTELKEQQVDTRYPYQSGFSMLDVADCGNIPRGTLACNSNLLASHNSFDLPDDILEERHDIMPTYSGDLAGTHLSSVWQNDSSKIESAKMEFSSDHETWRKQLETSVSGNNRYRNDGDFTLQEFEVDVSDFNEEVEMRCAYQSGFSMQSKDVMDQDYCSPLFTSRNSFEFSDDIFIEDRDNIRQKYSDDMEGNPLSSDWPNEFPENESGNITLSSDHEISDKQLKFGERGRVPFLHGCSFMRSPSSKKGLLNSQEEAEHPISESHYPDDKFLEDTHNDRHKYNDDMDGNLVSSDWSNEYLNDGSAKNVSSSNNEVWSKQLKIGESAKDHFFRGRSRTRSLSGKGLLNCEDETEVTVVEPLVKRRRVCFNKNVDVIEDEINNQRDDILFGQGEQTFTQGTELQSDFVPHMRGSISSGNKFPRSNRDSETSDSLLEACWGVKNFPQDATDGYEKGKNHCHLVGTKKTRLLSLHRPHMSRDKVDWLQLDLQSQDENSYDKYSEKWDKVGYRSGKKDLLSNYSRRSHSAPPFYKQKKKFISLNGSLSVERKPQAHFVHDQENKITYLEPNSIRELNSTARPAMKNEQSTVPPIEEGLEVKMVEQQCTVGNNSADFTSSGSREVEHFTKWRNSAQENRTACDGDSHHSILDITSGFSSLTGSLLIPESRRTNFLKQAKVLQQVDKKFIPVVADGTLAVIDQHAADERIRLEELRDKVLTGKARTISYLDAEQELILPEFGYQLLADYADQVRDWGWICNMRPQNSGTFNKNLNVMHQHRAMVTLIAVPCILGVKLSGGDLLEFLEQLADTDGASTVPPCIVRILNLKACRGAIMFGDSLLPSECALIVEELEKTELCFQCAHGRPTTVPLVNLATLHCEIAALMKNDDSVLRRQQIGISRALQRLNDAGDMQPNTVK